MSAQKLHIDWGKCAGRGHCIELLEEKLHADEWGYPYSPEGSNIAISEELADSAREAVAMCPMQALKLV